MAKQSLHSATATATAVAPAGPNLPAIFTAPPNQVQARAWAPMITFAHPSRADEWKRLNARFKDVNPGDMFFVHNDVLVDLRAGAKLGYVNGKQLWVHKKESGELIAASETEKPAPFKEAIQAVVLVYFEDSVVPANVQFRTTKCPIGKALADALNAAHSPAWAEESPAHKETLVLNQPFLRFYGYCTLGAARPGKGTGLPYRPGQCDVHPTSLPEFRLIKKLQDELSDPASESTKLFALVAARHESVLQEFEQKLVK